jgi:ketosteroid isomerase-like protein
VSEHPNATRAREGFERFRAGDLPALLGLFADDAVWHVPGTMELSGAHRGREAIVDFLRRTAELTGRTYRVELLWTVADDAHLVAVYRALGERPDGRELDIEQALLVELDGGRWKVVRAQPLDQAAFDAFWHG